jgi:tetratricopeptide (TPR) repeat protein
VCASNDDDLRAQGLCLQWQLHELQAFRALMLEADEGVVDHATVAAAQLPDPMRCVGASWDLQTESGATPDEIESVHASIAEARTRLESGRLEEALIRSTATVRDAQRLGARALEAEALVVRGRAAFLLHGSDHADRTDPETSLYAAWLAAEAGDHPVAAAEALVELTTWTVERRRFDDAKTWSVRASESLEHLQGTDRLRARLQWSLGAAEAWQGRLDAAYAHLGRAQALLGDPDDPFAGRIHNTVGEVAFAHGDYDRAEQGYLALLELVTQHYGEDHIWVANAHGNLGETELARHDLDEAQAHFERALAIRMKVLGPQSYWVAHTHAHLADVFRRKGELDLAARDYEQVLAAPPNATDPASCDRSVWARRGLALVALERGDLDRAQALLDEVRDAVPKSDPAHLDLCDRFDIEGRLLLERGDARAALEHLQRARAMVEQTAGTEHRNLVPLLTAEARALRALGREAEAGQLFDRATAIHARDSANDPRLLAM